MRTISVLKPSNDLSANLNAYYPRPIFDENKEKIQAEVLRTERVDVEQLYEEMEQMENKDKSGFFVELTNLKGKVVYIVFMPEIQNLCMWFRCSRQW